jgi:hypothetical protein
MKIDVEIEVPKNNYLEHYSFHIHGYLIFATGWWLDGKL